jgi:hypothetical protein
MSDETPAPASHYRDPRTGMVYALDRQTKKAVCRALGVTSGRQFKKLRKQRNREARQEGL